MNETRSAVQAEITKLKRIIASLSGHLNEISDIWRLPDEILSEIFHWIVDTNDAKSSTSTKRAITLSAVCQRWRRILLNTSTIWGRIDDHDTPSLVEYSFDRSRNAPLYISWATNDVGLLTLPLQHMHRVKSLQMVTRGKSLEYLERFLLRPSPILEDLSISNTRAYADPWAPSPALATYSPNLRSLSLDGVPLSWPASAHSWKNLTHIKIRSESYDDTGERILFSAECVVEMFAQMPLLETATFYRFMGEVELDRLSKDEIKALAFGNKEFQRTKTQVKTQRLRILEFQMVDMRTAFVFFKSVALPIFCSINIECNMEQVDYTMWVLACMAILFWGRPAITLEIGGNDYNPFENNYTTMICVDIKATFPVTESRTNDEPTVTMHGWRISRSTHAAAIAHIWRLKSLHRIHTLKLAVRTGESVSWTDVSAVCSELRHVILKTAASVDGLVAALERSPPAVPQSLRHIEVAESCEISLEQEQALSDALRWHRRTGRSLDRLEVFSAHLGEAHWDGLADEVMINQLVAEEHEEEEEW